MGQDILNMSPQSLGNGAKVIDDLCAEFNSKINQIYNLINEMENNYKSPDSAVLAKDIIDKKVEFDNLTKKMGNYAEYLSTTAVSLTNQQMENADNIRG